jgi:glycosyltransferase involved in cell wall biosynthesis
MKVVHVITGLDPGGAEAVLFRLVTAGHHASVEHHVISLTDRGAFADRLEQAGVGVSVLGMPRGRVSVGGFFKLYRRLRQLRPQVVQTWMYHADLLGGIAARLAGVRAVAWGIRQANTDPDHNRALTLQVVRTCARLSKWVPERIISCSERATQLHQALGYSPSKFINIPNGYPLERLKPDPEARRLIRTELCIPEESFVLGMVARHDSQKDHANLIDALSRLKRSGERFVCLLAGLGMDAANETLARLIAAEGVADDVRLLGPRNDIPSIMSALDLHVLSSLSEAFPNVLAEAMACGTPCVTTDVGDAALIVGEQGWVVPPRDAAALANAIGQARTVWRQDPAAWRSLQQACRSRIMSCFALDQMCQRYHDAWRSMAAGRS